MGWLLPIFLFFLSVVAASFRGQDPWQVLAALFVEPGRVSLETARLVAGTSGIL
jgi:hypothetical protein